MTAKPKTKRDVSPFVRGQLATAVDPILGGREAKFILDITDLEHEMIKTLNRIRSRDGRKVFKESSAWLRGRLDTMIAT